MHGKSVPNQEMCPANQLVGQNQGIFLQKKKSGHLQKIPQLAAMETQYRRMSFGGLKLMG
jgi:hypothetical protein